MKRPWLLILPAFIIIAFNAFIPFFYDIYLSTQSYHLINPPIRFIGINNFQKMVWDSSFLDSLGRGLLFTLLALITEVPLGLAVALLLIREFKGRDILRTVLCIPLALPPIALGILWLVLTSEMGGPIPHILRLIGVEYRMTYPMQAYVTTLLMDIWHWTPLIALISTAGIAAIPSEYTEAAQVDGASAWKIFKAIVLPMIRFPLLVAILIRMMDVLRIYDEVWMLTGGGPARTTEFLSLYLVRTLTAAYNVGYGAAMSLFFIYLIILLTWVLLFVIEKGE